MVVLFWYSCMCMQPANRFSLVKALGCVGHRKVGEQVACLQMTGGRVSRAWAGVVDDPRLRPQLQQYM